MAVTVGDLLNTPGLALSLVAGGAGLSNPIRWVHVSELEDPTPWLKGGELLLTTGMGVGKTAPAQRAYVERLLRADLAGLGFGVGFSFERVPGEVAEAAEEASFPVFEVPYPVPFIAITEAIFTRLAAEQYEVLSRSLDAEHSLTRAVLEGRGIEGIVATLARVTGGSALLLDLHGANVAASPSVSGSLTERVWQELRSQRASGSRFSLSLVEDGQHLFIQPVSAEGRVEAFLAVAKGEALSQLDRIVSSHALSLLALEMSKARAVAETERRLRGDLLDQLLSRGDVPSDARRTLERFGFRLDEPVAVVALGGTEPPERLARVCEDVLVARTTAFLVSARDDMALAVVQPASPGYVSELRTAAADRPRSRVMAGGGSFVTFDRLSQGVREARYALKICQTEGREQAEFGDLGTYQLLLSLQDPDALGTFASSVLGPLDEYDRRNGGELVDSLRAFLEHNARWEDAAGKLYVHRHTLRYRMRKVQELTGRSLSSATDRMEFLLALRARDLLASEDPYRAGLSSSYNRRGAVSPSAATRARRKG